MICVSIAEKTASKAISALKKVRFAEIRLDAMSLKPGDIENIFSKQRMLIATCRPGTMEEARRKEILAKAIECGASYVDIELESVPDFRQGLIDVAKEIGCKVIISYHNYSLTPQTAELEDIVSRGFGLGADVVKIACKSSGYSDNARLMGLLTSGKPIVAIGMGELGIATRIAGPLLGGPFTFASLSKGKETAEGQIPHQKLEKLLMEANSIMGPNGGVR